MTDWTVEFTNKTDKNIKSLPENVKIKLLLLVKSIEKSGPMQHRWPNFSKLSDARYHCHLKKGNPTYVACWQVTDKKIKLIEVYYAGTHEKAPY